MPKRKIRKKCFVSAMKEIHSASQRYENQFDVGDDIDLKAKIDAALNNKIPPTLNTKIRRKQDGIFYTEKRITSYIVSKTIGKLCADKKVELGLNNEESFNQIINQNSKSNNNQKKVTSNPILKKLEKYRRWLLSLSICDPACGSGAFLNAALDFLKEEHYFIDKFTAQILGHSVVSSEYEISILTNNLFGVDINEESVEITKLALRLRTSKPNRKLNFLDANIKCGNSLISDPKIDHDKSFDWRKEFPRIFERGGFDVVIGNPPYVFSRGGKFSEIEKEYYYSSYPLSNYQLNTYLLFIDLAYYHLLRDGGVFGFIVPNNCLTIDTFQPFRKFLLEQTGGVEVVNIINNVFKDANVDNCIITFKKQNADKISIGEMNDEKLTMIGTFPTSIFAKEQYIINIAIAKKPETAKLVEKIENKGRRLSDASVIKAGLKAYETGKGQPTQTDKMKKQRIYHSDYQKNKRYKKYLMGKDVCRYSLDWGGQWLKYGVNLASPRSYEIFSSPRILVRQIPSRYPSCINAVYTDELFLNDINSMIIFDFKIDPLYLLGILNSRLTSFWFINKFDKFQRAIFPQFKIKELALFPVIICDNNKQKTIADLVDKMISFHAELRLKRKKFFKLIADFFENVQQLKIVENLDQLEYKEFLEILNCSRLNIRLKPSSCLSKRQILRSNDAEIHNASRISKRKIKFDVENQSALEKIFNDYQSTCRNISKQIIETNRKIDQLVYELYELNDEEIKIIET